jgi:LemA protein
MDITTIVLIIVIVFALIIPLMMYNALIRKKNQVENIFASLDALLKKRYDLIPNLIATVQNYMEYEKDTLTKITELRTKALSPDITSEEKVDLNNQISKMLGSIKIAVENYPELKASNNFMNLQSALNEIEEQISAGRRAFNAAVTELNNAIEMFPSNIMAKFMNLKRRTLFEITESERQNVDVKSLFKS